MNIHSLTSIREINFSLRFAPPLKSLGMVEKGKRDKKRRKEKEGVGKMDGDWRKRKREEEGRRKGEKKR